MKLNFPSITYLVNQAGFGLIRFPFTVLSGLGAAILAIYMTEFNKEIENFFPLINLMLCCALAISLFFGIQVLTEKNGWGSGLKWTAKLLGVIFLLFLYYTFPDKESTFNTHVPYVRFGVYAVCMHLFVSFAPFIKGGEINGFWQYNKKLFLRFWASVLYSGFLYVGLVLAMIALQSLFDYDIKEERYFQLFILIVGWFNTWFFVSGIPKDLNELEKAADYPKGLKVFTQFILFPLLILYLTILYAYIFKILINWDWPAGTLSFLIIFVAILGILCILLMYPFSKESDNKWITTFSKVYYVILLPLIALLFWAVYMRHDAYGLTIYRFIVYVIAFWLTFIAVYFIGGGKNIKIIPSSLTFFILIFTFGPWSMFKVSENSQISRIEAILTDTGFLKEGKLTREVIWEDSIPTQFEMNRRLNKNMPISDSLWNEIYSAMIYLDDYHGFNQIKPWFSQDLDSILIEYNSGKSRYLGRSQSLFYMESMGLPSSYGQFAEAASNQTYLFYIAYDNLTLIGGFEYMYDFYFNFETAKNRPEKVEIDDGVLYLSKDKYFDNQLNLYFPDKDSLFINLNKKMSELYFHYGDDETEVPRKDMLMEGESKLRKYRLQIDHLNLFHNSDTLEVREIRGKIMWKKIHP